MGLGREGPGAWVRSQPHVTTTTMATPRARGYRRLAATSSHLRRGLPAAPAAAPSRAPPVIKEVVAQILRLPDVEEGKGDSGQDTLVVRVTTECGITGFGEVEAQPEIAKAIIDAPRSFGGKKIGAGGLRVELIGENALDHERLWNRMYDATSFFGRHAVVIQAMAGIDMALCAPIPAT